MRLWLVLPWILVGACAEGASATPANRSRAEDVRSDEEEEGGDQGGVEVVDASTPRKASRPSSSDAGQARAPAAGGSRATPARDAGSTESRGKDSGLADAEAPDSGKVKASEPEPEPEPKPANTNTCCSAGPGLGCGDSALQECVCALSPRCCSDAWDESCARLVKEKNCQAGVRDCVCGSEEGQWQQAYCCEGGWNATCESVSIHKCGATAACP
jgi:hypothetical protein